jgi:hypothetical protein
METCKTCNADTDSYFKWLYKKFGFNPRPTDTLFQWYHVEGEKGCLDFKIDRLERELEEARERIRWVTDNVEIEVSDFSEVVGVYGRMEDLKDHAPWIDHPAVKAAKGDTEK